MTLDDIVVDLRGVTRRELWRHSQFGALWCVAGVVGFHSKAVGSQMSDPVIATPAGRALPDLDDRQIMCPRRHRHQRYTDETYQQGSALHGTNASACGHGHRL